MKTRTIKTLFITLIIFIHETGFLFAQTNLELANKYYDTDDYPAAVEYFKKTIFEDKIYDGTIFYRYAYSMEQLDFSKKEFLPFYSAAAYLFEISENTEEKYYSYAIAKEEKLGLSHKKYSEKTIEKLLAGKVVRNQNIVFSMLNNLPEEAYRYLLIFYCIFVVVIYIVGRLFSKNTECVIFSSVKEIVLLILPVGVIVIGAFTNLESQVYVNLIIIFLIISFITAIVFSIINNLGTKKPLLYSIVSLLTKLSLLIFSPLLFFLILGFPLKKEEKDRRFRDGTKNNQSTKNLAIMGALFWGVSYFFYLSLMKTPKRKMNETRNFM